MPRRIDDVDSLLGADGLDLGATEWLRLEPGQLAQFAAATGAAVPAAGAPAPPLFVLALTNLFLPELLDVRGASAGVNYGTGPVRFPTTTSAGDRLRGRAAIVEVTEIPGGVQARIEIRVEVEGAAAPACVVESLSRWLR